MSTLHYTRVAPGRSRPALVVVMMMIGEQQPAKSILNRVCIWSSWWSLDFIQFCSFYFHCNYGFLIDPFSISALGTMFLTIMKVPYFSICKTNYFKLCFLKEIGNLRGFVIKKSLKIGKIEKMTHKRHPTIFLEFNYFSQFCIESLLKYITKLL